jgi:hypothetical protein
VTVGRRLCYSSDDRCIPLPPNWAFDQVKEYPLWSADGTIDIDKDVTSGRYLGFDHLDNDNFATVASIDFKYSLTEQTTTAYGISWKDIWFAESTAAYNPKLATAAMALSALAYSRMTKVETGFQKFGFASTDIARTEFLNNTSSGCFTGSITVQSTWGNSLCLALRTRCLGFSRVLA